MTMPPSPGEAMSSAPQAATKGKAAESNRNVRVLTLSGIVGTPLSGNCLGEQRDRDRSASSEGGHYAGSVML